MNPGMNLLDVYPDISAALVGRNLFVPVLVLRSVVRHRPVHSIAQVSLSEACKTDVGVTIFTDQPWTHKTYRKSLKMFRGYKSIFFSGAT